MVLRRFQKRAVMAPVHEENVDISIVSRFFTYIFYVYGPLFVYTTVEPSRVEVSLSVRSLSENTYVKLGL